MDNFLDNPKLFIADILRLLAEARQILARLSAAYDEDGLAALAARLDAVLLRIAALAAVEKYRDKYIAADLSRHFF